MVSGFGDLNGSGPQQIWVDHRRVGQDQAGNFSQFYVEVRYYGNGYGSWTGGTLYWSVDAAGWHIEGSFSIPQSARYDTYTVLWAGYYNRAHDAAGNLGGFYVQGNLNGSVHASIGSGSVGLNEPASPRIPKRPSAPPFSIDQVTSDSFRVVVNASADNGGSPIQGYLVRVNTKERADSAPYEDFYGTGTRTITGRNPGTRYYVTVYAKNGAADNGGYSTYQASKAVDTFAGVFVSDGAKWVATTIRVSDGSAWDQPLPKISDGDSWEDPLNV
ncbi:minor tail protein [Microbacterium phage DelaGarza]|nr:minor tail protein [Microbacterium phage DelaGarza]